MSAAAPSAGRRRVDWLPWVAGGLTVLVLVLFILWPILQLLVAAFLPVRTPFSVEALTLANFSRFITAATYRSATLNTVVVSTLSTFFATALALPAAYAVARIAMPFRNLILALSVVPLVAPPFIGAFSWITLFGRTGIVTHHLELWFGIEMPSIYGHFGVILAMSLSLFPYVFLIVQGALAASDPHIEESAQVMGASRWRILRTLTFPLVTPAIGAAAMIVFIKALGNFGVPAVLGGEMYVLPTLMYFQVNGFFNLNAAAAIAKRELHLPADRQHRVQRRGRILEHHRDLAPAHAAQLSRIQADEFTAVQADRSCHDAARLFDESQDREAGDGLAGARLADQPDDLARGNREAHVVNGLQHAGARREVGAQAADLEQGRRGRVHRFSLGFS